MFRAAFPNAPEHEEKNELQWVRDNYDLTANNGGSHNQSITRLAGTWVGPALARTLGNAYALGAIIDAVVEATPDPKGNYRRSNKATTGAANGGASNGAVAPSHTKAPVSASHAASKSLPTPSPSYAPSPAKRRKEGSPSPASVAAPASPPPSKVPLPRRSARTKSPAPKAATAAPRTKTPKLIKVVKREEIVTPRGSDETAVDEENEGVEDGVAGSELHQQDVAEQKKLIADLKAKRAEDTRSKAVNDSMEEDTPATLKRAREDGEELRFDFKEPEIGERTIATNRRVSRFQMEPRTKSFAWGVAAFAVGMGAV